MSVIGGLCNLQIIWRDSLAGQNAGLAPCRCREVAAVHRGGAEVFKQVGQAAASI